MEVTLDWYFSRATPACHRNRAAMATTTITLTITRNTWKMFAVVTELLGKKSNYWGKKGEKWVNTGLWKTKANLTQPSFSAKYEHLYL